jgi:hypothetical protein
VEFYGPAVVIAHNTAQPISGDTQLAYNLNVFDNTGGLMHDTSTLAASKVVNIITDGTYAFSHFAAISLPTTPTGNRLAWVNHSTLGEMPGGVNANAVNGDLTRLTADWPKYPLHVGDQLSFYVRSSQTGLSVVAAPARHAVVAWVGPL